MKYLIIQNNTKIFYRELGESLYDNIFIFSENKKFGIQTYDFEIIIPPVHAKIKPAYGKCFWAKNSNMWNLHNFENQKIGKNSFTKVDAFKMKFACVSTDGENFGFINRKGDFVISENYIGGAFLGLDYFAVSILKNNEIYFGVIDLAENIVHPFTLKTIPTFSETVLYILKKRKPLREWLGL